MKIALTVLDIYADPKLRYNYIARYDAILRESLSPSDTQPTPQ